MHSSKTDTLLSFLLLLGIVSISSCTKEYQAEYSNKTNPKYERFEHGGYNMIWLPSSKSLSDENYVKQFQSKLHSEGSKSNEVLPLNESIFAVEGVLNFEKCDASQTRVLEEISFELSLNIETIDEDGEVWIQESDLLQLYTEITPTTDVGVDEKISTIDLDVIDISSTYVQVRVVKTVSKKDQTLPPDYPFESNTSYDALGADVIASNYLPESCASGVNLYSGEAYYTPCHVGYPAQPYPSWVIINDALINHYNLMEYTWMNGSNQWAAGEKVWYTNIQDPMSTGTRIYHFTEDDEFNCTYGRRDKLYMGGNSRSDLPQNLWFGASGSCGCEEAPESISFASDCGVYLRVPQNAEDDEVNGGQMNGYFETVISHVEERLEYFEDQGVVNPAVASIKYYGTQSLLEASTFGIGTDGVQRSHYCEYRIGTKN